jgi:hypothetical protein
MKTVREAAKIVGARFRATDGVIDVMEALTYAVGAIFDLLTAIEDRLAAIEEKLSAIEAKP